MLLEVSICREQAHNFFQSRMPLLYLALASESTSEAQQDRREGVSLLPLTAELTQGVPGAHGSPALPGKLGVNLEGRGALQLSPPENIWRW